MTAQPALFEAARTTPPATERPITDRALMGAVYTPDILARWVARLLREHSSRTVTRVLDPACGDGALIAAVEAEVPEVRSVVGIDISEVATTNVQARWGDRASTRVADTLLLTPDEVPTADAAIMNPPWGTDLGISRDKLRALGYQVANGQYDSWDLFIEWTVKVLPTGTTVAAIIPDAVFLPEHRATRRLLLDRTRLHLVARMGEGWFEGVFRGVAVLVYTTGEDPHDWIRCIRLPHDARKRVLGGRADLVTEVARIESRSRQAKWATDPEATFMPAGSEQSAEHIRVIESQGGPWTEWVTGGRGVEIGKSGALVRCGNCGFHRQPPRNETSPCIRCGSQTSWAAVAATTLGRPSQERDWAPLIVGADVKRYSVTASRWLRLGLDGVQYKDATAYRSPKLLVRKTGLGLNASVDTSGSFTTQVVFHYLAKPTAPNFALDYLEGLLSSRVLLAVHLACTGETEWRSHPYVTPKVLATLPIPTPQPGSDGWRQAEAVAEAVRRVRSAPPANRAAAEATVDRLVAGLYGLDDDGCAWVDTVLARTQFLQAFSHFRAEGAGRLRSESVA